MRAIRRLPLDIVLPACMLAIVFLFLLSPAIFPIAPPVGGSVLDANQPSSLTHPLGTDPDGNDIWSRLLHGGRASLMIAVAVNLAGLVIGTLLGASGAWFGGLVDAAVTRALDVLIAFPPIVLALSIAQALQPGNTSTIVALALFTVPAFARISRASTLRLREQPFMTAARLAGTGHARIMATHIVPNILPQLATFALLGMGAIINIEGAVNFLGLGVPAPHPSWGNMIYQGQLSLSATPSLLLLPGALLFVTVLSFNVLSEALRVRWSRG